jgi:hypothetical protein
LGGVWPIGRNAIAASGIVLVPEVAPIAVDDETLVWIRDLARIGLGTVRWQGATKSAVITRSGITVELPAAGGKAAIWIAQEKPTRRTLPHPPRLVNGKLMVPLRFICSALGVSVTLEELRAQGAALSSRDHPDPQASGAIKGMVCFAGHPAPGIVLRLVHDVDSTFLLDRRAVSGADGCYLFPGVSPGEYRVYCFAGDNPGFFNRETAAVAVGKTRVTAATIALGRALGPVMPQPGERVPLADQITLEWTACPEAVSYELSVVDRESGEEVVMRTLQHPQTTIPGRTFTLGRHYEWRVLALGAQRGFLGSTPGAGGVPWTFVVARER